MGNRAIIKSKDADFGVYLHWNGGIDSVTAFLKYCKFRGFRPFDGDGYGIARFCQIVGNFFGGDLSIGVVPVDRSQLKKTAEWLDNGVYIVKDWDIIDRIMDHEPQRKRYDVSKMIEAIDNAQPEIDRLGEDFFNSTMIPTAEIKVEDKVLIRELDGHYYRRIISCFGDDRIVNGQNVLGRPYYNKWTGGKDNINNYIFDEYTRVIREE